MATLLGELFRWLRLAIGLFAAWQTPLALFAKRQNEKVAEREFVFVAICGDTDGHGVLRHVAAQSTMKFVPPAENGSPIGIRLALDDRMMNAVHPRRDDNQVKTAFELDRQPPVRMMKQRRGFEGDEKNEEQHWRDPENQDSKRKKPDREKHLAEMKSRRGADIHIQIGVVHVMESPEERNHVIGPMPPPVGIIHQQKRSDASGPPGRSDPVQQTDMPILRPRRYREWDWEHGQTNNRETGNREHKVAHQPVQDPEVLASQRKTPLQPEQREKYTGQQWSANIID